MRTRQFQSLLTIFQRSPAASLWLLHLHRAARARRLDSIAFSGNRIIHVPRVAVCLNASHFGVPEKDVPLV